LPLKICAEITIRVHHNLISHATLGAVHRVYSKWNAISQCRHWLANNLPRVDLCDTDSTTKALEFVQRDRNAAAIASRQAAVAYGVPIISADIEDRRNNRTRFAVIGHQVADRTGDDKTTIMFQLPDEPGSLCDALTIVKKNEVNMSWIESFPGPEQGKEREWLFFADLEGHQKDAAIDRTLSALEKKCSKLVVLGTFPCGAVFD
jgi:chorismate mutase / prephenate dehydratase